MESLFKKYIMQTTQKEYWQEQGFNEEDAAALAGNVRNFVFDTIDENEEGFDYSEEYAGDYKDDFIQWAKLAQIIK